MYWLSMTEGRVFFLSVRAMQTLVFALAVCGVLLGPLPGPLSLSAQPLPLQLESNPGASHALYLQFVGYTYLGWPFVNPHDPANCPGQPVPCGRPVDIPSMFPGDPALWTQAQLDRVHDIWRRVAEDFSGFDVNVTTAQAPALLVDGQSFLIAIGGSSAHVGGSSGIAGPYAYSNPRLVNTALVSAWFNNMMPRTNREIAATVSEEAGHAYGLNYHYENTRLNNCALQDAQASYDAIMGKLSAPIERDTWYRDLGFGQDRDGTSRCRWRSDLTVLYATLGFRADDEPGSFRHARSLAATAGPATELEAGGVIGFPGGHIEEEVCVDPPPPDRNGNALAGWCEIEAIPIASDQDAFIFNVDDGGTIEILVNTINVNTADQAANLDVDVELWRTQGTNWMPVSGVTSQRQAHDRFSARISYLVPWEAANHGLYGIRVLSRGAYGVGGHYTARVIGQNVSEVQSRLVTDGPPGLTTDLLATALGDNATLLDLETVLCKGELLGPHLCDERVLLRDEALLAQFRTMLGFAVHQTHPVETFLYLLQGEPWAFPRPEETVEKWSH